MLLRFRTGNHTSIKDVQELLMTATLDQEGSGEVIIHAERAGLDVLPVTAIFGANASGKSNVLKGLGFVRSAVLDSHRSWMPGGAIPRSPFLLNGDSRKRPSLFEVDFLIEGVEYSYGFELDSESVLREWLHAYPNRRRQVWFSRDGSEFRFGKHLRGQNRSIEALTRSNSLFLSAAAMANHEQLSDVFGWFARQLRVFEYNPLDVYSLATRVQALESQGKTAALLELVRAADLGIVDLDVGKEEMAPEFRKALRASMKAMADTMKKELKELRKAKGAKSDDAIGVGESLDEFVRDFTIHRVALRHTGRGEKRGVPVPFDDESRGTRAWIALCCHAIEALENGVTLCVDELDTSLHPHLASQVVRLFQDSEINRGRAQLIFNSHDTNLLGDLREESLLRRDQVWITEKDKEGATRLYPLTDFRPRKHENLERGYLQGRYGGIPIVNRRWLRRWFEASAPTDDE